MIPEAAPATLMAFSTKVTYQIPTAYSREVTFALGKIAVSDKIYVTFELKP